MAEGERTIDDEIKLPSPVATSRCVSTESAASVLSVRSRLNRVKYVLLIDQEKNEAVLQRCSCPRCAGVLRFRRRVGNHDHDPAERAWDDDYETGFDDLDMPPAAAAGSLRGVTEEELYELRSMSKATRRSGTSTARTKQPKKKKPQQKVNADSTSSTEKRRDVRRREVRDELQKAHLEARKANINKRVASHRRGQLESSLAQLGSLPPVLWRSTSSQNKNKNKSPRRRPVSSSSSHSQPTHLQTATGETVLTAQQLGMDTTPEGRQNYDRLLQIMRGDDINPNDFDLLLSLDETVQNPTLQLSQVEAFPLLSAQDVVDKEGGMCLICLQPFREMEKDVQLRKLPCCHTYCKGCIDKWLTEISKKCPDLSCFWTICDDDHDHDHDGHGHTDNASLAAAAAAAPQNNNPPTTTTTTAASSNNNDFQQLYQPNNAVGTNAITSALITSASSDLWPPSDFESFLHKPEEEGGLSTDVVLEKISDAALAMQHFDTIMDLQKIYDRLDDGVCDEEIYDDLVQLYNDFFEFIESNGGGGSSEASVEGGDGGS